MTPGDEHEQDEDTWERMAYGKRKENGDIILNYIGLQKILDEAFEQATKGKGMERHGEDKPIENQTTLEIARLVQGCPHAGTLFQVLKKAVESTRLEPEHAIKEMLGVIVYGAFSIILLKEEVKH